MVASSTFGKVEVDAQSRTITISLSDVKTFTSWTGSGSYWFLLAVSGGTGYYKLNVNIYTETTNVYIYASHKIN